MTQKNKNSFFRKNTKNFFSLPDFLECFKFFSKLYQIYNAACKVKSLQKFSGCRGGTKYRNPLPTLWGT